MSETPFGVAQFLKLSHSHLDFFRFLEVCKIAKPKNRKKVKWLWLWIKNYATPRGFPLITNSMLFIHNKFFMPTHLVCILPHVTVVNYQKVGAKQVSGRNLAK